MRDCQAVLFDAAGTLLEPYPSVGAVYAAVAREHGVNADAGGLEQGFRAAWKAQATRDGGAHRFTTSEKAERRWWREMVRATFERAGEWESVQGRFDAYFHDVYRRFEEPAAWRVFDDVRPTLEALTSAGVRCAVASNWDSRLPRLLDRLELAPYFEAIVTSASAGWSKPDPRLFEIALERLGVAASQALHVGDSPEMDVAAARAAGLEALLIHRRAPAREGGIASLLEIPARLGG